MTTEVRCDFCNTIKIVNDLHQADFYRVDFWNYHQLSTRMGHKKFLRLDICKECFKRLVKK